MNKIQEFEMWLSHMDNKLEQANKAGIPLMVYDMKNEKYPNGYEPKIEYWTNKADSAMRAGDLGGYHMAVSKVQYFKQKQKEVYPK